MQSRRKLYFYPVKFFALIMGFLMMGLSNLPCNDCSDEQAGGIALVSAGKDCSDKGHEAHEDQCSPFCHCSCCAGLSINQSFSTESLSGEQGKPDFTSFLPANVSEVSLPVWQPPQINS